MRKTANLLRVILPGLLLLMLLSGIASATDQAIQPFSSDGCSLFPDGTLLDQQKWCGCCEKHDIAYWQGGTEAQRLTADEALRDCVLERTGDQVLAEAMYLGVRAGGHPAFPVWYRWGYGWAYGRGYQALNEEEREQVASSLTNYAQQNPQGFCAKDKEAGRPAVWAEPLVAKELENFYRLDAKLYRSAQPSEAGFAELKKLGIVNILNLREYHSDQDPAGAGFNLHRVKMAAGSITTAQVIEALRFIQASKGPVLVHCWHGSDRTGMVSAMYRLVFQGWTKEAAIDELANGGYGYHAFFYQNIPEFIRKADIPAIRKAVLAP